MFFIKSKEEKEQERLAEEEKKKKICNTFKSLLESDTISVIASLIQSYVLIFSIYRNEVNAQEYLTHELQKLLDKFNDDDSLAENYINSNAKNYYNENVENLQLKLKVYDLIHTEESITTNSFNSILIENLESIIDNENLITKYIEETENKDIVESASYAIDSLMTIPILIVSIFTKIQLYNSFYNQNIDSQNKNLITILENVSQENIESRQIVENISYINTYLYDTKPELSEFDIYIYILALRKNILIENYRLLIPNDMVEQADTLINNLKLIKNDVDAKKNIEDLRKEYINNYLPKSFVKTDQYTLQYFDYYICTLLIQQELISLNDAISYFVKGFISENYEKTSLYKKALWDNDRYLNNDFSIELQIFDLLQRYENVQNGYEFEEFCYSLYNELGYYVEHTKLSNDQGADLIIEKDGVRTVVQAKHYAFPVGNKAVQEVVASKAFYDHATHAIVITNSTFTPSAIKLSEANAVELVDGDTIKEYIAQLDTKS